MKPTIRITLPPRATPSVPTEVSRTEARKLSYAVGKRQEPYRGYGYELKDKRFLFCAPDGKFYIRETVQTPAPVNTSDRVNPYTLEEERLWQSIVGSELATAGHVATFERTTGKKHNRNYLI